MQSEAPTTGTEERLPLGYVVDDNLLEAYAEKCGIVKSPQIDIYLRAVSALQNEISPLGSHMAHRAQPIWNTDSTGDTTYLQVSGWKGCLRGEWRADEEVERAYCDKLGLEFGEGRVRFTPLGYWEA